MTTSVIVAGGSGLGRLCAERFAARGDDVVVVSSRDPELAAQAAVEIGGWVRGLAVDLTRPHDIAGELTSVDSVDKLTASRHAACELAAAFPSQRWHTSSF